MTEPLRKPWWNRRRWRVAVVLWFAIPLIYAASIGPAMYCLARGWVSQETLIATYVPLSLAIRPFRTARQAFNDYAKYWHEMGTRHAMSDAELRAWRSRQ